MTERPSPEQLFDMCTCDHTDQCKYCRTRRMESSRDFKLKSPTAKVERGQSWLNASDQETIALAQESLENISKGEKNWGFYANDFEKNQLELLEELQNRLKPGEQKETVVKLISDLKAAINNKRKN